MSGAAFMGSVGPLFIVITAGAMWVAWRVMAGSNARLGSGAPLPGTDGETVIPVRELIVRGGGLFGGMARNGIKPSLTLTPEGVRFRVLREDFWSYRDLGPVGAAKTLMGAQLVFRIGGGRLLIAAVRDLEAARLALSALPPGVPLTAKAAALRQGRV